MSLIEVLIITGDGVNCENETKRAFEMCGPNVRGHILHINDLEGMSLDRYSIIALPGGFSYGDELGSGKVFSLKLSQYVGNQITEFISAKKPIIGICNGFQVLTKLGVFDDEVSVGLTSNESGQFINKWSELVAHESHCIWTKGIKAMRLPIRHGEGRFVFSENKERNIQRWQENGRITLSYKSNPNGAHGAIAGVTDTTGLVLGLMPHPEAAVYNNLYPGGELIGSLGLDIFKNAVSYIENLGENNA